MEALGAPPELAARWRAAGAKDEPFLVHADNVPAVTVFLAMGTQWRTQSLSTMTSARLVRTGLDYGALAAAVAMTGVAWSPEDFARLRVLEDEALAVFAEKLER